eukprot:m51a1_g14366 hypothetical protein (2192) ;mRNA; f:232687-241228
MEQRGPDRPPTSPTPTATFVTDKFLGKERASERLRDSATHKFATLLEWMGTLSPDIQARPWAMERAAFLAGQCTRNTAMCAASGVCSRIVQAIPSMADPSLFRHAVSLLEQVGAMSLRGDDVRRLLRYVSGADACCEATSADDPKERTRALMAALTKILDASPAVSDFFLFDDESCGIQVVDETPVSSRWPPSYTFCAWVWFDATPDATSTLSYEPRLVSFVNKVGTGVEIYLARPTTLVVKTNATSQARFTCRFECGRWYHIVVCHYQMRALEALFKPAKVVAYVDGIALNEFSLKYPVVADPLEQRCIGNARPCGSTYGRAPSQSCFSGRLASLAMLHSAQLTEADIARLYALGPSFVITQSSIRRVVTGSPPSVDISFVAQAGGRDGRCCSTVQHGAGKFVRGELLGSTMAVHVDPPRESLAATVGVCALLPLFHVSQLEQRGVGALVDAAALLECAMRGSQLAAADAARRRIFEVLTRVVSRAPKEEITVDAFVAFSQVADGVRSDELRQQAYCVFALNFDLWKLADPQTQRTFAALLLDTVSSRAKLFRGLVRRVVDALRVDYSYAAAAAAGLAEDDVVVIRRRLCQAVVHALASAGATMTQEEAGHVMYYILGCTDPREQLDAMQVLDTLLLVPNPAALIKHIEYFGGVRALNNSLSQPLKLLRLCALVLCGCSTMKVMGRLIKAMPDKQKSKFLSETSMLFIKDALQNYEFDEDTYVAMISLLTENSVDLKGETSPINMPLGVEERFPNHYILPVVFSLIVGEIAKMHPESVKTVTKILQDIFIALEHNNALMRCFLDQPFWQARSLQWLLDIIVVAGTTRETARQREEEATVVVECCNVAEQLAMRIMGVVVRKALVIEDGWRAIQDMLVLLLDVAPETEPTLARRILTHVLTVLLESKMSHWSDTKALNLAWRNFSQVIAIVDAFVSVPARASRDERGKWADADLVQLALRVFDDLWRHECIRSIQLPALDVLVSKKGHIHVLVLKLSFLLCNEAYAEAEAVPQGKDGTVGSRPAVTRVFTENTLRAGSVLKWVHMRLSPKECGAITCWSLCALFHAMRASALAGDDAYRYVFPTAAQVIVAAKSCIATHIAAFVAHKEREPDNTWLPKPTLAQQQHAQHLAVLNIPEALLRENAQASDFVEQWLLPTFFGSTKDTVIAAVRAAKIAFDAELDARTRAAARKDAERAQLKGEIARLAASREAGSSQFAKDAVRELVKHTTASKAAAAKYNWSMRLANRAAEKGWRRIVRENANEFGCWDYSVSRALFALDGRAESVAPELSREPLWKLDMSYETPAHARPFIKTDLCGSCQPRMPRDERVKPPRSALPAGPAAPLPPPIKSAGIAPASTAAAEEQQDAAEWTIVDAEESAPGAAAGAGAPEEDSSGVPCVGEPVLCTAACTRVSVRGDTAGRLCLTATCLYFFPERGKEPQAGAREERFKVLALAQMSALHNRKYTSLSGIEIFMRPTGRGYMFTFARRATRTQLAYRVVTAAGAAGAAIEYVADPTKSLKKNGYLVQWLKGSMSNFDYLMALNVLAGRTFNDLAQYFVFPWVLTDYSSEKIDLRDVLVFRDLSKPVGALNPARLDNFIARYEELESHDPPEVPPFLYGSHYSALGSVLFWLVRMEPFSSQARDLQGGDFDVPDRLFLSVEGAWSNCLNSSSDVKELTPEFFYLADFLRNANGYSLGRRQTGAVVDDCELPRWAPSAEAFVRVMREALESDYVSAHLHEWIDLVFGYKQRGQEAIRAHNVFYYLTYDGAVDTSELEADSMAAEALRTQLKYFGQTPQQLFVAPHPARDPPAPRQHPCLHSAALSVEVEAAAEAEAAWAFAFEDCVVVAAPDGQLSVLAVGARATQKDLDKAGGGGGGCVATRRLGVALAPPFAAHAEYAPFVLAVATWRTSLKVIDTRGAGLVAQELDVGWLGGVSAMQFSDDGSLVAIGGECGAVGLWDVARTNVHGAPVLSESPRTVLRGHSCRVTAVAMERSLSLVTTAAQDGTVAMHCLRTERLVRLVRPAAAAAPAAPVTALVSYTGALPGVAAHAEGAEAVTLYTTTGGVLEGVPCAADVVALLSADQSATVAVVGRSRVAFVSTRVGGSAGPRQSSSWALPPRYQQTHEIVAAGPWGEADPQAVGVPHTWFVCCRRLRETSGPLCVVFLLYSGATPRQVSTFPSIFSTLSSPMKQ